MVVKTTPDRLVEDEKIRNYLQARLSKGGVARVVIERISETHYSYHPYSPSGNCNWKRWI